MLIGQLTEGVGKADKFKQAAADIISMAQKGGRPMDAPTDTKPLMLIKLILYETVSSAMD